MAIKHRYTGVEFIPVTSYTVNFKKEVYKLEDLYKVMHEWVVENGYGPKADEDFPEKYFMHKVTPGGKEIWVRWRLKKVPYGQEFWRYDLDVDMHVLGLQDVEVMVDNKKVKGNMGEVEVNVAANLIVDVEKKWAKNPLLKPFRNYYFKRFLSQKRDFFAKQLYTEAFAFRDVINNYLKLETFIPVRGAKVEFWPRRA
ncbi:MAG: hypothetical protein QW666_03480 [Candidatus Woesearchaeota archaeon]